MVVAAFDIPEIEEGSESVESGGGGQLIGGLNAVQTRHFRNVPHSLIDESRTASIHIEVHMSFVLLRAPERSQLLHLWLWIRLPLLRYSLLQLNHLSIL